MKRLESALYCGQVLHTRFVPRYHHFNYQVFLFWLKLSELDQVSSSVKGLSCSRWSPVQFRRSDYLGDVEEPLEQSVLKRMRQLSGIPLRGDVFLLGSLRMLGAYFSPVNLYYLRNPEGDFCHMLAEVSNTPWNERHHYLVNLKDPAIAPKAFHVSPFNPMNMTYHWQVPQPGERLNLALSCHGENKHFEAALNLGRQPLNSKRLFNVMLKIPSMTIKTLWGIYWQAFRLWVKGVPVYPHSQKEKVQENDARR